MTMTQGGSKTDAGESEITVECTYIGQKIGRLVYVSRAYTISSLRTKSSLEASDNGTDYLMSLSWSLFITRTLK